MAGTELGKAYVQIIPSAKDIKGKIQGVLDPEATSAGESSGKSYSSTFGSMLKANLVSSAVTGTFQMLVNTAGNAIQSVVSNFAEFEQLTGGVETLFKDSAGIVEEYAANAYRTAGLSANAYMETVTGFSASLLQSLGGDTEAAARMADLAITDMADNANKMGSDMSSIQNAYQGFAKQNYTMLDNLKIGYGGTKTEMERLLDDAEKIKAAHGEMAEYSIDSYADVVEAIHVVQTEMGITGTTAAEASETVQGSIGAMKAAWENLLTGLGRSDADLDKLVNDFADTAETAIDNLMPVADRALQGVGTLIDKLGPIVADKMPDFVATTTPILASALGQIFGNLLINLPALIGGLAEGITMAIDQAAGIDHVDYYIDEYGQLMPVLEEVGNTAAKAGGQLGAEFAEGLDTASAVSEKLAIRQQEAAAAAATVSEAMTEEEQDALTLAATMEELAGSYPGFVAAAENAGVSLGSLSQWLSDNGLTADEWGKQVQGAVDGVINKFAAVNTDLGMSLEDMASNLQSNISAYENWNSNIQILMDAAVETGNQSAVDFVNYMIDLGVGAADQVAEMASDVDATMATFAPMFEEAADAGMTAIFNEITGQSATVSGAAGDTAEGAKEAAGSVDFTPVGYQMDMGMVAGIQSGSGAVSDAARATARAALNAAKFDLQIQSPSKVMRDEVGVFITEGIAEGIVAPEALYALDEAADVVTQRIAGLFGVDMNGEDSDAIKAVKAWKDAWEDALDDTLRTMEHGIFLMEKNGGEYDSIVASYRKMQEEVHRQAEQARAMGLDENSEYIQKLQKKWWSYEDSIRKMDEDREKAALKLLEEQQKELEKLQKEADKTIDAQLKNLNTLANQLTGKYQDSFNEIARAQEAMQNKLSGYGDLFSEKNGYNRLNSLDTQTKMLERYGAVLDQLQARGINGSLMDEVLGMNVEDAIWYGEKLMQMSSRDFANYMDAYQKKEDLAAGIAEKYYAEDYEALNTEYLQDVLNQVGDLFAGFLEELPEGGEFRDYIESSVAEGFAETLESLLEPILGGGAADFALENAQQFSDARDAVAETRVAEQDETMINAFGNLTRDIVNGVGGLMDAHMNQGESELSVEVGGETLARILLPYLIATAKANGTPIVNVGGA